jgi:hypothetical protein
VCKGWSRGRSRESVSSGRVKHTCTTLTLSGPLYSKKARRKERKKRSSDNSNAYPKKKPTLKIAVEKKSSERQKKKKEHCCKYCCGSKRYDSEGDAPLRLREACDLRGRREGGSGRGGRSVAVAGAVIVELPGEKKKSIPYALGYIREAARLSPAYVYAYDYSWRERYSTYHVAAFFSAVSAVCVCVCLRDVRKSRRWRCTHAFGKSLPSFTSSYTQRHTPDSLSIFHILFSSAFHASSTRSAHAKPYTHYRSTAFLFSSLPLIAVGVSVSLSYPKVCISLTSTYKLIHTQTHTHTRARRSVVFISVLRAQKSASFSFSFPSLSRQRGIILLQWLLLVCVYCAVCSFICLFFCSRFTFSLISFRCWWQY